MTTFWLFLLVFTAIACGWLLGRFAIGQPAMPGGAANVYRHYFRGLNYLLNDRSDEAIDTFVDTLEVTKETLETHVALGNLMRRKGEVERAIRIHQNLLARPNLPPLQLQQAHLELARDYISAGLYDRAYVTTVHDTSYEGDVPAPSRFVLRPGYFAATRPVDSGLSITTYTRRLA